MADDALKQADEITRTLKSLDEMVLSIQAVADSAHKAAVMARTASTMEKLVEIQWSAQLIASRTYI